VVIDRVGVSPPPWQEFYRRATRWDPGVKSYFTPEHHHALNRSGQLPSPADYAGVLYNYGAFVHEADKDLDTSRSL
jgi:hypothetical protein